MTASDKNRTMAAGYIRVSQERSARNGYGLAAQENDIRRYAEYRGWTLAEIFREEGVSGYKRERPALSRMLTAAKADAFHVAVFPSIDRAGRSVRDVIETDRALRSFGVETVFIREGVDTSTPTGELFRNIMASMAEFEGRVIYERLSKGKERKAAQGGYTGGWLPYGFRRGDDGNVAAVPDEAAVVKRIFRWSAKGVSQRRIAERLNAAGVPTRKGGPWRRSTIYNLLHNTFHSRKHIS